MKYSTPNEMITPAHMLDANGKRHQQRDCIWLWDGAAFIDQDEIIAPSDLVYGSVRIVHHSEYDAAEMWAGDRWLELEEEAENTYGDGCYHDDQGNDDNTDWGWLEQMDSQEKHLKLHLARKERRTFMQFLAELGIDKHPRMKHWVRHDKNGYKRWDIYAQSVQWDAYAEELTYEAMPF